MLQTSTGLRARGNTELAQLKYIQTFMIMINTADIALLTYTLMLNDNYTVVIEPTSDKEF